MKIFVGCSSSNEIPSVYIEEAKACLSKLFTNGHDLVFGACNNGIMGVAYNCALENSRDITGICPKLYKDDLLTLNCNKELLTNSISERTDRVIEESDILLFMPGGIGTIYELLTAIECKRSHEFDKPIIIYNSSNFFDNLLQFLNKIYTENFTSSKVSQVYNVINTSDELVEYLNGINNKEKIINYCKKS